MISVDEIKNRFDILGNSRQLNDILKLIPQIARTDITVLITGESGTGKEVIAHALHGLSPRANEKLMIVNCGAIPEGILESELFGHERGAFTGAIEARKGYFELANNGTLFLDEIGDMPLGVQVKLLRVLESGEYMRVGSSQVRKTDVRVVAATNKDLLYEVQAKKFREDLYYRLRAVQLHLPPLHERREDIPVLFQAFWLEFSRKYNIHPVGLTKDAIDMLVNYHWPGNVRELRNLTESVLVLDGSHLVDEQIIRKYLIQQSQSFSNRLPAIPEKPSGSHDKLEMEYLYRMMVDLKTELMDIKNVLRHLSSQQQPVVPVPVVAQPVNFDQFSGKLLPASASQFTDFHVEKEPETQPVKEEHSFSLTEMEKRAVEEALNRHTGNRRKAAEELKISERTLYRKIKEYGLEP